MDELTDLAREAGRGCRDALATLVSATQPDVWRFCAHLVDRESADDLTQETYLRAVRELPRFRGEGPVRSWLLTIARRVCAAEITARQRQRDLARDVGRPTERAAIDPSLQVETHLLLQTLDPDRRAAFVLTQLLGCSYAETAQICGCPIGTVRSRVTRARSELVRLFSQASHATDRTG